MPQRSSRQLPPAATASSTAPSTAPPPSSAPPSPPPALLLDHWLTHDSLEFHYFSEPEAVAIRQALLQWYDQHRRKLPWRGDASPWEGSTVNFGQTRQNTGHSKRQSKRSDFVSTTSSSSPTTAATDQANPPTVFPVTPYGVWVSEIMLQQTRVEAVVPYWVRWMRSFPTVSDLAQATPEQVNAHFAGLGFYRRCRLLRQACQHLHETNHGVMPTTSRELMELPGVGRYTACAIASIAHNEPVAVVDGNVGRVLARLRGIANQIKAPAIKDRYGWDLAQQLIEAGDGSRPGDLNQALMELGATYCAPSGTGTDPADPLVDFYWSTKLGQQYATEKKEGHRSTFHPKQETKCPLCAHNGIQEALRSMDEFSQRIRNSTTSTTSSNHNNQEESWERSARQSGHSALPLAPPKPTRREDVLAVAVLCTAQNQTGTSSSYLLVQRPPTGLLAGQWEFPATCVWTSTTRVTPGTVVVPSIAPATRKKALDSLLRELSTDSDGAPVLARTAWPPKRRRQDSTVEHVFSHVRHTMWIEHKEIDLACFPEVGVVRKWRNVQGRHVRWMNADEMSQVGVTAGVKKILKALESQKTPPTKKRRQK